MRGSSVPRIQIQLVPIIFLAWKIIWKPTFRIEPRIDNATQGPRTLAPAGTTAATEYIVRHPAYGPRQSAYVLRPHSMHM